MKHLRNSSQCQPLTSIWPPLPSQVKTHTSTQIHTCTPSQLNIHTQNHLHRWEYTHTSKQNIHTQTQIYIFTNEYTHKDTCNTYSRQNYFPWCTELLIRIEKMKYFIILEILYTTIFKPYSTFVIDEDRNSTIGFLSIILICIRTFIP